MTCRLLSQLAPDSEMSVGMSLTHLYFGLLLSYTGSRSGLVPATCPHTLATSNKTTSVIVSNVNYNDTQGFPCYMGGGGRAVERRTVNRGDGGSIPPVAVSKLR